MSAYTITAATDVPDVLGDYPGEMHMLTMGMDSEQVAFTYRRMPPQGGYGHSHKTQEEVYFVISGTLQFKLGDEIVDVGPYTAVRIAPATVRSVWNEGPGDVELVMCSPRGDTREDVVKHEGFWPE
ncbi:MAG: cupin domain-containing protein [Actinomycetota bacterium]|nr:cupin domain-containing protein [Actinomycetota bacterium]